MEDSVKVPINEVAERTLIPDKYQLVVVESLVSEIASNEIIFTPALITRDEVPIIRRGTINIIQGKPGSHKSRFAETICSMLLREESDPSKSLGFEKMENGAITTVYIDTERNKREEFPMAIRSIVQNAGFQEPKLTPGFRFTSLKHVERKNRLNATKDFIEKVRRESSNPLFVILDVATDCVRDFNDSAESMTFFDFIGNLCESYNSTFLLTIHENPGTEKARGHVGTQGLNVASTAIHIGFEVGRDREPTSLIQIKFVKLRHSQKLPPIPIVFSEENKSLELADPLFVKSILDRRRNKANVDELVSRLGTYLKPSLQQKHLLDQLTKDFDCSSNTLKSRLSLIATKKSIITNESSIPCRLSIMSENGKPTFYELVEIGWEELM